MPSADRSLCWHAFRLPKRGHSAAEYEDACAGHARRGRFAVADGASESAFAALWARLLVRGFVRRARRPWGRADWLAPLRRRWAKAVDGLELPWYAEAKREQGAFATLLALALRPPTPDAPGQWRALAVGDCCLFHLSDGRLVQSFPLDRSSEFSNLPALLGSRAGPADWPGSVRQARGTWQTGDRFLLMSDALAQWCLRCHEQERPAWVEIEPLLSAADPATAFAAWVEDRRDRAELRNDDVTLLVIRSQEIVPSV